MVESYIFSTLPDGRDVTAYRITNRWGESATLLNYGAMLQSLRVLDRKGQLGDVVLGPDEGENPAAASNCAAIRGRCGNRIAYGRFSIDGRAYQLRDLRKDGHHLHGGSGDYAKKLFTGVPGEDCVTFYHRDLGEDGWEAEADAAITYRFGDDHALTIEYRITALGDTVISPTNHAYFNLDYPREIRDTRLTLMTETYAPKGPLGMPEGEVAAVKGTPLDFSTEKSFAQGFAAFPQGAHPGYDDFFVMPGDGFRQVAQAVAPGSGRRMRVFTDAQCLILYTPGPDAPHTGKHGAALEGYCSFCLETQYVPNAVNCSAYRSPVFRKGEVMTSRTVYAFDTV